MTPLKMNPIDKIIPKELLSLEPGKIYVMKYIKGSMEVRNIIDIVEKCMESHIQIIPIGLENLDNIKFETKV